jgi:hypothetical protein
MKHTRKADAAVADPPATCENRREMQDGSAEMSNPDAQSRHRKALRTGPFSGQIDPWAEQGWFFHQIHGGMIGELLKQIQDPLMDRELIAAREASLQIGEATQPDVIISLAIERPSKPTLNYPALAEQLLLDPGIAVELPEPELDAIYITDQVSGRIITIIEIVSPSNKADAKDEARYMQRRDTLVYDRGVQVVEVDLTRSIKRLLRSQEARNFPYHIAIHLPYERTRMIGIDWSSPIPTFALPLRDDGIPLAMQPFYATAYYDAAIAAHLLEQTDYRESSIPFPSTLTDSQREEALKRVENWKLQLEQLRAEIGS